MPSIRALAASRYTGVAGSGDPDSCAVPLKHPVVVLINPHAARVRALPRAELLSQIRVLESCLSRIHEVRVRLLPPKPWNGPILENLLRFAPRLLVVWGGDGTVSSVLDEAYRCHSNNGTPLPPCHILPGGQFNFIASSLGIPVVPWKEIHSHLDTLLNGMKRQGVWRRTTPLDVLHVSLDHRSLYGLNVSGLNVAGFLDRFYRMKHRIPRWLNLPVQLARLVFQNGMDAETVRVGFFADGEHPCLTVRNATLVMASTVRNISLGLPLCHRAQEQPGRFNLVVSRRDPSRHVRDLLRLPTVDLLSLVMDRGGDYRTLDLLLRTATVDFGEPGFPRKIRFCVDGELTDVTGEPYEGKRMEVEVHPHPLTLVYGPS